MGDSIFKFKEISISKLIMKKEIKLSNLEKKICRMMILKTIILSEYYKNITKQLQMKY